MREIFRIVKEKGYMNKWIWNKVKKSPSRKHTIEVFCEHEVESFKASLIIRDRQGNEIKRKQIFSEQPDEWFFVPYLGKVRWLSSNKAVLINKKMDQQWEIEL